MVITIYDEPHVTHYYMVEDAIVEHTIYFCNVLSSRVL